jgi:hypothetical protein
MKGPAPAREENRALVGRGHELGPGLIEVLLEPDDRALADGNDAILPPLALSDREDAPGKIEIVQP